MQPAGGTAADYSIEVNPENNSATISIYEGTAEIQKNVDAAREDGAELVVLLSHNGFDVDRKLASKAPAKKAAPAKKPAEPEPEVKPEEMADAIEAGARGAYWDILRRLRGV